jgi:hypothetical protein
MERNGSAVGSLGGILSNLSQYACLAQARLLA